ncbi:MAG: 3-deoxy-manno-octulosonate cytidylyltransferase [Candidatus Omnitrophica bacterium]|nr:3-deoxy-manno-octulosonate cytidylyltransferase [Candidatus Omnitrophota bacterium]
MDIIGVIPARFSSTRFEGKVLAKIMGKSMLQHVWERAGGALLLDELIIACDDERVAQVAREFGAKVTMTSKDHLSGTDRIVEVINPIEVKIAINIQADEPLIHPTMIDSLARELLADSGISVATLIKKIEDNAELDDPNIVKVVADKNKFALYFSRAAIPYKANNSEIQDPVYYKHIGLYGYTKDFLFTFKNLPPSSLENIEKLEQLRVLEEGFRIRLIETKYETIGVDVPEDLKRVIEHLEKEKS